MKNIFFLIALFFLNNCVYAMTCDRQTRTCEDVVFFLKDSAVVWTLTAQSTSTPEIEIGYSDNNKKWVLLANSTVHSTNFNNRSTGKFRPPVTGVYRIIFHDVIGASSETAVIEQFREPVVITHLFALEDGIKEDDDETEGDGDFNDAFAVVNWFVNDSIPLPVAP